MALIGMQMDSYSRIDDNNEIAELDENIDPFFVGGQVARMMVRLSRAEITNVHQHETLRAAFVADGIKKTLRHLKKIDQANE